MRLVLVALAIAALIATPLRAQLLGVISSTAVVATGTACTAGALDLSLWRLCGT